MGVKATNIRCLDCANATYMQWFKNPVVCECKAFEERFVAEAKHNCDEFEKRTTPVVIQHFDKYEDEIEDEE